MIRCLLEGELVHLRGGLFVRGGGHEDRVAAGEARVRSAARAALRNHAHLGRARRVVRDLLFVLNGRRASRHLVLAKVEGRLGRDHEQLGSGLKSLGVAVDPEAVVLLLVLGRVHVQVHERTRREVELAASLLEGEFVVDLDVPVPEVDVALVVVEARNVVGAAWRAVDEGREERVGLEKRRERGGRRARRRKGG